MPHRLRRIARTGVILFAALALAYAEEPAEAPPVAPLEDSTRLRRRGRDLWFFYRDRDDAQGKDFHLFWPIFEKKEQGGHASFKVRPFYSQEQSAEGSEWSLLWPLIHSERSEATTHRRALPFYWSTEAGASRTLITPFWYQYRDAAEDRAQSYLFPNLWYQRHGESWSWHAFPLFGTGGDGHRLRFWSALWPLFKGEEAEGRTEYDLLWPLGGYRRDDLTETRSSWSPLHYSATSPEGSLTVTPLAIQSRNSEGRSSWLIPPLLFALAQWADATILIAGPYWQRTHEDGRREAGLFPLSWHSRGPGSASDLVIPYFFRSDSAAESTRFIFPFLYMSEGEDRSALHVPPLFWSSRQATESWTLVAPFYWNRRSPTGSDTAYGPLLFVGSGSEPGNSYLHLPPLYWSTRSGEQGTTLLAPLFWNRRTADREDTAYGPLVYTGQETSTGNSYLHIAPLYWSTHSGDGTRSRSIGAPLIWYSKNGEGYDLGVAPFLFTGEGAEPGNSYLHLPPLYWSTRHGERKTTLFAPFYGHQETSSREDTAYGPLVFAGREKGSGDSYLHAAPLYWSTRSGDGARSTTVAAPLLWRSRSSEGSDLAIAPLFFKGEDSDGSYLHLAPVYFSWTEGDTQTRIMAPGIMQRRDGAATSWGVLPLLYFSSGLQSSLRIAAPFYFAGESPDGSSWRSILGLGWHWEERERESSLLLPCYYRHERFDGTGSTLAILPLFYWDRAGDETSVHVLFPLIHHRSAPDASSSRVLPLYFAGRSGDSTWRVGFPLYWDFETPERRDLHVWPLFAFARRGDGSRTYSSLWPIVGYEAGPNRSAVYVRPFYSQVDSQDVKVRALYPLFYTRTSQGSESADSRCWLLWPLFDRSVEGGVARSSVLFYAFRSEGDATRGKTQLLWRLFRSEYDEAAGRSEISLLYGLFQREQNRDFSSLKVQPVFSYEDKDVQVEGGGRYLSVLLGMFSYESFGKKTPNPDDDGRMLRFLWVPFRSGAQPRA